MHQGAYIYSTGNIYLYNTPSRLHRARETTSTHKYNSVKLLVFWFLWVFPIIIIWGGKPLALLNKKRLTYWGLDVFDKRNLLMRPTAIWRSAQNVVPFSFYFMYIFIIKKKGKSEDAMTLVPFYFAPISSIAPPPLVRIYMYMMGCIILMMETKKKKKLWEKLLTGKQTHSLMYILAVFLASFYV
jgi:hypothetical protein